jgi:hypothetical protein
MDPRVGWGVVLADSDDVLDVDKAIGSDAPEPIRRLIADRSRRHGVPILRYRADVGDETLLRYYSNGTVQPLQVGLSVFGVGEGQLPLYLLIVGPPTSVPWRVQFSLNRRHHVGRLDLPDQGLENYVEALINGWAGIDSQVGAAVVWSTNYDRVTNEMESLVANWIADRMTDDAELTLIRRAGDSATNNALITALQDHQPSVIVTSSHGRTAPLNDQDEMRRTLGLPVDAETSTLDIDALSEAWEPSGAIWYAQACCSAGSNDGTSYVGLLDEDQSAHRVVTAVGALGATVSPAPTKLLGAVKPLRAFIGHVEPTFDWTLIAQDNGQPLTIPLVNSIYPNLYLRKPVARALEEHYRGVGELYAKLDRARQEINAAVQGAKAAATYYKLTATDRESLVVLGDPTAMLGPLPSQIS